MSSSLLMISPDLVGPQMAGTGMRYWELSRALARQHPVTLAAPEGSTLPASTAGARLAVYRRYDREAMQELVDGSGIVMAAADTLLEFPFLLACDRPFVVDGYDPHTLESLAWNERAPSEERLHAYRSRLRLVRMQCTLGDFFVCASERQRMLWLGWLEATGRINPFTYDRDRSLRALIDVVPTGIPDEPPRHTRPLVRGVVPGISHDDFVLVWGGGIWNWLDPLTLVRAVARVAETHPTVKLYFPGPRHPDQAHVPDMAMHQAAIALSRDLGVWERHVFMGQWVSYPERQNYLLEGDVGCSLHFDSIESTFAFRTRILDYIWAGLPMIVTRGDATGDMVAQHGLGAIVDDEDVEGVAEAIVHLLSTPRQAFRDRFARVQETLTWEQTALPLLRYCQQPQRAPDRDLLAEPPQPDDAHAHRVGEQEKEIARLYEIIAGYEGGRFIRWMKRVHQIRRRLQDRLHL